MNKPLRSIAVFSALASIALFLVLSFVPQMHAQTVPAVDTAGAVSSAALDTAAAVAQPFIVSLAQAHPWLVSLLAAIATFRLVFKPCVSVIEVYVASTPGTADDEWVKRAEASRAFKAVAWLIDYLASIKIGPSFKAKPEATAAK